jgi:hypothetical protein
MQFFAGPLQVCHEYLRNIRHLGYFQCDTQVRVTWPCYLPFLAQATPCLLPPCTKNKLTEVDKIHLPLLQHRDPFSKAYLPFAIPRFFLLFFPPDLASPKLYTFLFNPFCNHGTTILLLYSTLPPIQHQHHLCLHMWRQWQHLSPAC